MKKRFSLLASFFFWASCSNVDTYVYPEIIPESAAFSADFVKIESSGKSVDIKDAKSKDDADKNKAITVNFTYNYYIGKHEVTCGEYKSINSQKDCAGDSFPVANVTYIDAILYANAKSKAEGFDTAYVYSSKACNKDNCTQLEGFSFKPNVSAYRLPTEAEWLFAAKQGWNTDNSWNADNSGITAHTICSKKTNNLNICDMEGNVSEWVNDWLGNIWTVTTSNFAGAGDGGSLGERVIKGGNYHSPTSAINIYSRGDVYTVTSATTSDYLGFRLAYGRIPDAIWMNGNDLSSQITSTSWGSAGNVRNKTHTFKTKLAFRNDDTENLVFIDYSTTDFASIEIVDTISVYHPEISPDGERVAFCTKPEGVNAHSDVYVRDLNGSGSNLVKLDVESAAIPRWKVLDSGDTVIVYVSSAKSNKDPELFKDESTWMVPFANGEFGTPQKLFDGAYHGGVDDSLAFAVTGSTLLRAHMPNSADTVWYNGEQACNVSLAKDGSKRTLFLDFGGDTGHDFVGKKYGIHEQILVVDSTGKLIQSIEAPAGYSFDHTEWASSNLIVASLTNQDGVHEKIVLLDISDNSLTELVAGHELWHPNLWISPSAVAQSSADIDSVANYWAQPADPLMPTKMNVFWTISDSVEVVALGSSRVSMGFDPYSFEKLMVFNMATVPSDMDVSLYLAKNYILPHCKNLKALIVSLDLDLWSTMPEVTLQKNILSFPGFTYDKNHNFWKDESPAKVIEMSKQIISEQAYLHIFREVLGMVRIYERNSWITNGFNTTPLESDSIWSDYPIPYQIAQQEFEEIIQLAQEKGVLVVGVVFPQSPFYAQTGSFGMHGMRRSTATKVLAELKALESTYSNYIFMDENKMGKHEYPDDQAYDYDHLNYYGGKVIARRIDAVITEALSKSKR